MPTLEFLANKIGRQKRVEAATGGDLVDICDEHLAPIPFSCRSASCGTCQVEIVEGLELFEPPGPAEAELLRILRAEPHHRIACQAKIKGGPGLIRIRPVLAQ